jgi:hypothetical protein
MHCAYDLALQFSIDPVRELGQCFINPPPEGDTVCNRGRFGNRAEVGDELVEDLPSIRTHQWPPQADYPLRQFDSVGYSLRHLCIA